MTINEEKTIQINSTLKGLLEKVLTRGFYGTASVEFTVQDGTIQQICRKATQVVS